MGYNNLKQIFMQQKKFFFILLALCSGYINSYSQLPLGGWRAHFPFHNGIKVASAGDKIYCATRLGLVYFDTKDNSLGTLTKINGLSDIGISAMDFSEGDKVLLVGYENGNIDLVRPKMITNLTDIKRKHIPGKKSINSFLVIDERAYLACGFGIVVIHLQRNEISDTYIIGPGGSSLEIFDLTTDGNNLYAATARGVYYASLSAPNLADFSSWNRINTLSEPDASYKFVKWYVGKLHVVKENQAGNENILVFNGGFWESFFVMEGKVRALKVSAGKLLAAGEQKVFVLNQNGTVAQEVNHYGFAQPNPMDAMLSDDNELWIADFFKGLIRGSGTIFQSIHPNGPGTANSFHLSVNWDHVFMSGGGYDASRLNFYRNGEFFLYENENWISNFDMDAKDYVRIQTHPSIKDKRFAASWGHGVVEYDKYFVTNRFTPSNSTLQSIIPGDYCRIAGMVFDKEENLWVTNSTVSEPVSVKKRDGTWKSFPWGGIINHHTMGDIICTSNGHHWVLLPRGGGLFAFDVNGTIEDTNDDRIKRFSLIDENGAFITNEVYSFVEDKNGAIWVGTNDGIVVYFNPQNVFSGENFHARRIIVPGINPGEGAYLLANEVITSIFVDGGNRKWVGTEKAGVFLLSPEGTGQILHFTTQNSPLISDNITSIAVHPKTGEVFIATTEGLVSYRADATEGKKAFTNVLVFPNPVRPEYDGPISITGLMEETIVKITDINGYLVHETISVGGQATWDGKNLKRTRVSTGVYLIFLSNRDGSETHVSKILFIR